MKKNPTGLRVRLGSLAVAALLSACGGGGGGGGEPPTPLPDTLSVTAPSTAETSAELQFGNSAATTTGLSFSWDFGDGQTSAEATPKHKYSKGGDYDVKLKISNAAGASREQSVRLSITNLANVRGLNCSKANDGGWCWQQPRPSGNPRSDSFFVSAGQVFTVGDFGELFKSADGGTTWTKQDTGVTTLLRRVRFSSPQHGWITGADGVVLRTTDGGASWARRPVPEALRSGVGFDLIAIDDKTAIVGTSGLHTVDGGETWTQHGFTPSPSHISPRGVFWRLDYSDGMLRRSTDFGRTTGVALDLNANGYSTENSMYASFSLVDELTMAVSWRTVTRDPVTDAFVTTRVLMLSSDGGQNWRRLEPKAVGGAALPQGDLRLIRAGSADNVMLADLQGLWSSVDGGQTWSQVFLPKLFPNSGDALSFGSTVLMPSQGPFISRPSEFGGEYAERGLSWSGDGGRTWSEAVIEGVPSPTYERYQNLRRVDGDMLTMQDINARTFISTDGGRRWKIAVDAMPLLRSLPGSPWTPSASMKLAFFDAKRGLMVDSMGRLRETADGGKTWDAKTYTGLPTTATHVALRFASDKTGWLLQSDGRLYKSTDGGATWGNGQLVRGGLSRFDFVDENRGWGSLSDFSGLVITRDGGQTWTHAASTQVNSARGLHFGAGQQLIAYGGYNLLMSSMDNGQTWTELEPRSESPFAGINKVTSSDANTLWAVRGGLSRSTDRGSTWTAVAGLPAGLSLADVAFADARTGWAVGRNGAVIATTDGGMTWVVQPTRTQRELWRVLAIDGKTAWIEGEAGTVLATGNGGF